MNIRLLFVTAMIALISLSFMKPTIEDKKEPLDRSKTIKKDSVLRHVVLFKFKEETSDDDIDKFEKAFGELPDKIPEIYSYEWGLNNSPEGLEKGFTHCFLLAFKSEEDRSIYLPHPDHKAFVSLIGPSVEDVLVIDYWAQ